MRSVAPATGNCNGNISNSNSNRSSTNSNIDNFSFRFSRQKKIKKKPQRTKTASCNYFYSHANATLTWYSPPISLREAVPSRSKQQVYFVYPYTILERCNSETHCLQDSPCLSVCPCVRKPRACSIHRSWHRTSAGTRIRNHSTLAAVLTIFSFCLQLRLLTGHYLSRDSILGLGY